MQSPFFAFKITLLLFTIFEVRNRAIAKQCGKGTENAMIVIVAFRVKRSEAPKFRLRLSTEFLSLLAQKNRNPTDCDF